MIRPELTYLALLASGDRKRSLRRTCALRRLFRQVHGDILTVAYWQAIQDDLAAGKVPRINIYPEACRLAPGA